MAAVAGLVACPASAQTIDPACAKLAGTWTGSKSGSPGYQGPITITFENDCSYSWIGKSGLITITVQSNALYYKNDAGSQGKVRATATTLEWRYIYTGDSYQVKVTKQPN